MLTDQQIFDILYDIKFRDWDIVLRWDEPFENQDGRSRPYIQVQFDAPDAVTGEVGRQHCRKWMLSPHMTATEIVRTALKAILAAVEHEALEDFKYKGVAIHNPHTDVESLVKAATEVEVRA